MSEIILNVNENGIDIKNNEGFDFTNLYYFNSLSNERYIDENLINEIREKIEERLQNSEISIDSEEKYKRKTLYPIKNLDTKYADFLKSNSTEKGNTVISYESPLLKTFTESLPEVDINYIATACIKGEEVRIIYNKGELQIGILKDKYDITKEIAQILGGVSDSLKDYGLIELQGVLSKRKDSTEKEFFCYRLIIDGFEFESRDEEYDQIITMGFKVPEYLFIEGKNRSDFLDTGENNLYKDIVSTIEESNEDEEFYYNGVLLEIDDNETKEELKEEGKESNIELRTEKYSEGIYEGYITQIRWRNTLKGYVPIAIISETPDAVFSETLDDTDEIGVKVKNRKIKIVPLYSARNILILNAYEGNKIYFKYLKGIGAIPCLSNGNILVEDLVEEILGKETIEENIPEGLNRKSRTDYENYLINEYYGYLLDTEI